MKKSRAFLLFLVLWLGIAWLAPLGAESVQDMVNSGRMFIVSPDGTYLGVVSNNAYDSNSLANQYGTYGNPYSSKSIFNQYGTYGGEYSSKSVFNGMATEPPLIYYKDLSGEILYLGKLTVNDMQKEAVNPRVILIYILEPSDSRWR